jgi:hypothetical protein
MPARQIALIGLAGFDATRCRALKARPGSS